MVHCKVCGSEVDIDYRPRSRMFLCDPCHKATPRKVDRQTFDQLYWQGKAFDVPDPVKREFYDDYKTSNLTLRQYVESTTNKSE